ncbi:hypothetical protein DUNSADRAFT_4029, partial [Dunaliella salina]
GLRALESGLPGGLSDTQWQLLMLSEEVARLTQQLADLQGPLTKIFAAQGQARALSTSSNCNEGETASAASVHSCAPVPPSAPTSAFTAGAPTSTITASAAASGPTSEESGGDRGKANGKGGPFTECGGATSSQGADKARDAAGDYARTNVLAEDGVSGSGSSGAGLPFVDGDLGPRHPRKPSLKHPVVELHLPPAQLQQRVSELAATMMELEEQVEAELAKRKQREQLQEEQHSQVLAKDSGGASAAAATHPSDLSAPCSSSEPCLQQPHDQPRVPDTQHEQQQQGQGQPLQQKQQQTPPHSQPALCLHPPLSSSQEQHQPAQPHPPHLQQHHQQHQHQQQQPQVQSQPALPAHPHLQQHHEQHQELQQQQSHFQSQPALPAHPHLPHHYQQHQHQQQQSQCQSQPAVPAHPHLPVPSNLWERRLSRSLSMASLSGQSSGSPALDGSTNSHAVHVLLPLNGLSVEVGDGGGELDSADPPFVQQVRWTSLILGG